VLSHEWRISKRIRRSAWNRVYSACAQDFLPTGVMSFLNLGYLADPGELGDHDSADISDRLSELLYDRLVADVQLKGLEVAEVGCGPGGGSAYLTRTYSPSSFTAIDINKDMVAWGSEHHREANLRFVQGDAMELPIDSNSVDVLLNLESSHCYPSRLRFFEEVMRVLRPGGFFMFADLLADPGSTEEADLVSAQLSEAGLVIENRTDITKSVVASRDALSGSNAFRAHLERNVQPEHLRVIEDSLFMVDTPVYNQMAAGKVPYVHWRTAKPAEDIGALDIGASKGTVAPH
jgi:ubiquinone/menaquinone biosynthesis C-methylase UbiE